MNDETEVQQMGSRGGGGGGQAGANTGPTRINIGGISQPLVAGASFQANTQAEQARITAAARANGLDTRLELSGSRGFKVRITGPSRVIRPG